MANISSAYGTLTLKGDWNQEAIDLFQKVLNCWSFHGEYGLEADGLLSLDQRQTTFEGTGRWGFTSTLQEEFDDWTRDWIEHPAPDSDHRLDWETYRACLELMCLKHLSVSLSFEEEADDFYYPSSGSFFSDGTRFLYLDDENPTRGYKKRIQEGFAQLGALLKYEGPGGAVEIPPEVRAIGEGAFRRRTDITSVVLPDSVCWVGASAWRDCKALTSVTLPKGLSCLPDCAFCGCKSLTAITIPEGVLEIGEQTFRNCTALTELVLPQSVRRIGAEAFAGCTALRRLELPEHLTEVGHGILRKSPKVENLGEFVVVHGELVAYQGPGSAVVLPDSITSIQREVLKGNKKVTSLTLPEGVTEIGIEAFADCTSLTSVSFPASLKEIKSSAFRGCTKLACITVPGSVKTIGAWAFAGCTGLTELVLEEGIEVIDFRAFLDCTGLTHLTIPASVKKVGDWAFEGCAGLTNAVLSEGVQEVVEGAFKNCKELQVLKLPASVRSMDKSCRAGCKKVTIHAPAGSYAEEFAKKNNIPFEVE
ncbi:hypothetical protein B5G43_06245 [Flavonifractor sp. An92]|uniref:leucine-rich repeat domain-containing protein n=1 Tax=Flavonifractor sp. An92 TaxID=1965666 RepID=UPI000B36C551|nr:leucine-rich repeat domain-containing protein [Flavonifractor sp. An92]OUN07204.1 hypothetical protein B5G43_06245 [Flavonifractor sp. An92]